MYIVYDIYYISGTSYCCVWLWLRDDCTVLAILNPPCAQNRSDMQASFQEAHNASFSFFLDKTIPLQIVVLCNIWPCSYIQKVAHFKHILHIGKSKSRELWQTELKSCDKNVSLAGRIWGWCLWSQWNDLLWHETWSWCPSQLESPPVFVRLERSSICICSSPVFVGLEQSFKTASLYFLPLPV